MSSLQTAWEALKFGGETIYPLAFLGLLALAIMLDKAYVYARFVRLPASLRQLIETYGFEWEQLARRLDELAADNRYGYFFRVIVENRTKPPWWVESRAGDAALQVQQGLERGLWALETTVTAAPLLGLLGTITGMMRAFKLIGGNGLVDPAGVTSGVAQALIATALGLVIALIALFGFNFFSRRQAVALDEMERLGTRLLDHIRIDQGSAPGQKGAA